MAQDRSEPRDNKTPRAVRPWLILFMVFAVVAAGTILYLFSTRIGQTATPGAAPVGGNVSAYRKPTVR